MGSGPAWDVERGSRMSAGCGGVRGVMGAKNVLGDASARVMIDRDTGFCVNEKPLAADGAANGGLDF